MPRYSVSVDRSLCISSAMCVSRVPEVFDQDDDGLAFVTADAPDERLFDDVEAAVDLCPARAIAIRVEGYGKGSKRI